MAEKEIILEVKDLCKDFDVQSRKIGGATQKLHALSHVDLTVYRGETLGIIGESGCGKSTLGRCIVGLHKPTSGELMFEGKPLDFRGAAGKALHKKVQMVFQDPYSSLNPRKTCGKIIEDPMLIHKLIANKADREARVRELMSCVGLDAQHVHRYPHEFSGGQRQRINIARVLSLNPDLIVCDEPVSALDVSIQAQVINTFEELQEKLGIAYLFIAHDLLVVQHISRRIAVMYLGRIVEIADSDEVIAHPMHPYTQSLISAIPIPDPETARHKHRIPLEGDVPSPLHMPSGCPFRTRCRYATERCAQECPSLTEVAPGHRIACWNPHC